MTSAVLVRAAAAMLVALSISLSLAAQENQTSQPKHHHYKLIDIGAFGGPLSYFNSLSLSDRFSFGAAFYGFAQVMNPQGILVGGADTSVPDPFSDFCFTPSCFASHAFAWQNGVEKDLGTLPGGASSLAMWINSNGLIAGDSQNGEIDPLSGLPELRAVTWENGRIGKLRTLGGNETQAAAVNDRGQVAGLATNKTPDPFSFVYLFTPAPSSNGTQTRAVLWNRGVPQDLGTLGGPDASAFLVNQRGQVAGYSYTDSIPNADDGLPTLDPFLWDPNTGMRDLGNFGDQAASINGLNNRGEVVGGLWLPGNQQIHPFLWNGKKLIDLVAPPFGGLGNGEASWTNEAGEVVGLAGVPDSCPPGSLVGPIQHAFLWINGHVQDLGGLPGSPNSEGDFINAKSQIVGLSWDCNYDFTAVLWENGSIADLNTLVPADSPFLFAASFINDKGEIAAFGQFPNGDKHVELLIPCDENHPGVEGCDYGRVDASAATSATSFRPTPRELPRNILPLVHSPRENRFFLPALGPAWHSPTKGGNQ